MDPDEIAVTLARGRGALPNVPTTPALVEELAKQGQQSIERARSRRKRELLEGEVEVDPDLLNVGDEVADEVSSAFKRGMAVVTEHRSKFSAQEQRNAAQTAQDLMLERNLKKAEACKRVGEDYGVTGGTIEAWADKHGIDLGGFRAAPPKAQTWDIYQREELFRRQFEAVSLLTDRALVWIQNPDEAPAGWSAANEMKTIAVAAAILHDKQTAVEDLKVARGLRDIDSVELQAELAAGQQRLLGMKR